MLNQANIVDLLDYSIPEETLKERLLELVPDKVDALTFCALVDSLRATLPEDHQSLSSLNPALDCSGTGGSGLPRFNTSTTVAFILAAAGVRVTKFGNRAASGRCGSFDLLSLLGFPDEMPAGAAGEILESSNLVFLFAPSFYPALARLAPIRKAVGVPTILNFIGPLLNPVFPGQRLMGISNRQMQIMVGEYLLNDSTCQRALLARSDDGLDEIGLESSHVLLVDKSETNEPSEFEFQTPVIETSSQCLCAGKTITYDANISPSVPECREIFLSLIKGEDNTSQFYRLVCVNAGAGLYVAGVSDSIRDGMKRCTELLSEGAVLEQFQKVRRAYAKHP